MRKIPSIEEGLMMVYQGLKVFVDQIEELIEYLIEQIKGLFE